MALPGKKPGLTLILGSGPKGSEDGPESDSGDDFGGADVDAMKVFMTALKGEDPAKALDAYKTLNDLCGGSEEETPGPSSDVEK